MSEDGAIRASDAEREQAAAALREHYAAGRLSEDELAERLGAVYAARTRHELQQVRDDLPELPASVQAQRAALAHQQAALRRRLWQVAGGAFVPFVICVVIWLASGAHGSFWPAFVLIAPVLFVFRNLWALHGPSPELDRVQSELERPHIRRTRRMGPGPQSRGQR